MNDLLWVLLALALFGGVVALLRYRRAGKVVSEPAPKALPYRLKPHFFTRSEFAFFQILIATLPSEHFRIFPKVRLGDYIEPTNSGTERYGSWARIRSRHIDFLIWDKYQGRPILAIELDGHSHHSAQSQAADAFKDQLFHAVGLPLQRVHVGSDFTAEVTAIHHHLQNCETG